MRKRRKEKMRNERALPHFFFSMRAEHFCEIEIGSAETLLVQHTISPRLEQWESVYDEETDTSLATSNRNREGNKGQKKPNRSRIAAKNRALQEMYRFILSLNCWISETVCWMRRALSCKPIKSTTNCTRKNRDSLFMRRKWLFSASLIFDWFW